MSAEDQVLLAKFSREHSQDAFTTLVNRHLNLVYSAALRQVRSPQLAEEVSQSVFINLARNAERLKADTILTAWLYQVTRNASIDVIRREAARQAREQIAVHMNSLNDSEPAWRDIEPLLDEAMDALEPADRSALLLRFFENKSLREVGAALGASEDAAQKRVTRALERLRDHFSKNKISVGASALAALLSANAVQAAPAAVAVSVAAASAATFATYSTTATSIALTMTAAQKTIVALVVAAGVITVGVQFQRTASIQHHLQQQQQQTAALSNQVQELQVERDQARQQVVALKKENATKAPAPNETLKLKGEVTQLRQEKKELGATSGLSKATANPEARQLMREQQKGAMTMLYSKFAKDAKLSKEQTEKLNDLLADHIMDNVDNVTVALRQKLSPEQADRVFANQDAMLTAKMQELLGDEGLAQYQKHTQEILGNVTALQFRSMMTGDDASKNKRAEEMAKILVEEGRNVIAASNLPADYQLVPMLNFRNIASDADAERSLQLLGSVYDRALPRFGELLSKEEAAKFQEFKAKAISNNKAAIIMNRNLMAPIGD